MLKLHILILSIIILFFGCSKFVGDPNKPSKRSEEREVAERIEKEKREAAEKLEKEKKEADKVNIEKAIRAYFSQPHPENAYSTDLEPPLEILGMKFTLQNKDYCRVEIDGKLNGQRVEKSVTCNLFQDANGKYYWKISQ